MNHLKRETPFTTPKSWCGILLTGHEVNTLVTEVQNTDCGSCRDQFLLATQDNVSDHPTKHMVDIPIPVQVGETIEVNGQHFILTDFIMELNRPSTVIFKQPSEMMEEKRVEEATESQRFFREALDNFRSYEGKPLRPNFPEDFDTLDPAQLPEGLRNFVDGIRDAVKEILVKQKGPVGPLKVVDQNFEEDEDGDG